MSVLILIDHADGHVKKSSLEALSYGAAIARQTGEAAEGLLLGNVQEENLAALGRYGIGKIHQLNNASLNQLDAQVYAKIIAEVAGSTGASVVVFSHNQTGRAVAPRVAVRLKAGLVTGAVALPDTANGFTVKKSVFSGKAFARVTILSPVKVISLNPNGYPVVTGEGSAVIEQLSITPGAATVTVTGVNKVSGDIPLTEAAIVVSGGRGLKGPENWSIVENLAQVLHAGLACSRPVADAHWRPHHEHVGQTGVQIAPNLYIAIGISGAIQHLAGVNRSKVIVVVNKDAEAPFFKAADYGVVGDAFEVVPKLTEAIRQLKA